LQRFFLFNLLYINILSVDIAKLQFAIYKKNVAKKKGNITIYIIFYNIII